VKSLFVRLSAAFALTAGLAALVIGLVVYQQTASGLFDRAREKAAEEVRQARDQELSMGTLPVGAQYDTASARLGRVEGVEGGRVATLITGSGTSEQVWAAIGLDGPPVVRRIYVSDSLAAQEQELSRLRSTLVLGGLLATGVAALAGIALAAWLTSRLRRAAATARRIASGKLGERVNLKGSDEVASLAEAIDEMAQALEQRIVRERQFAADAAHELRTPLAGIVAASQLLPQGRPATIVRDGIAQLRRLVDQLLELARLEGNLDTVKIDQVDLRTLAFSAQGVYASVLVDAPLSAIVATDLRRVERILANLIENALCYGAPPVTIHVTDRTIQVSDQGLGFDPDLIPHVTERFSVGDSARSHGAGLGLAIAAEHARMLNARLELRNQSAGGAIVSLELTDLQTANGGTAP
jgi:signal transduction histidine kinase